MCVQLYNRNIGLIDLFWCVYIIEDSWIFVKIRISELVFAHCLRSLGFTNQVSTFCYPVWIWLFFFSFSWIIFSLYTHPSLHTINIKGLLDWLTTVFKQWPQQAKAFGPNTHLCIKAAEDHTIVILQIMKVFLLAFVFTRIHLDINFHGWLTDVTGAIFSLALQTVALLSQ